MKQATTRTKLLKYLLLATFTCMSINSGILLALELNSNLEGTEKLKGYELAQSDSGGIGRPLDLNQTLENQTETEENIPPVTTTPGTATKLEDQLPSLGKGLEGIWGLTDDACSNTQLLEDIVDEQTLAIKGNRIYFVDIQCFIIDTASNSNLGKTATIRCLDVESQQFETAINFRPIGALKLEISSEFQEAREYVYCSGLPD